MIVFLVHVCIVCVYMCVRVTVCACTCLHVRQNDFVLYRSRMRELVQLARVVCGFGDRSALLRAWELRVVHLINIHGIPIPKSASRRDDAIQPGSRWRRRQYRQYTPRPITEFIMELIIICIIQTFRIEGILKLSSVQNGFVRVLC